MAAHDEALLDGAEHGFVGLDVHVDIFELADLLAVSVDEQLATPVREVANFSHVDFSSVSSICADKLYAGAAGDSTVAYWRLKRSGTRHNRRGRHLRDRGQPSHGHDRPANSNTDPTSRRIRRTPGARGRASTPRR